MYVYIVILAAELGGHAPEAVLGQNIKHCATLLLKQPGCIVLDVLPRNCFWCVTTQLSCELDNVHIHVFLRWVNVSLH